jgi:phosphoglycolate phosphatase
MAQPTNVNRLVVLDFDGTLADSLAAAITVFNRLAPELGHKPVHDIHAARLLTTRQFLRQHGISWWRLPRLMRRFHAASAGTAEELQLFPGVVAALVGLHARGVTLGILSSNAEVTIRRCLRANGIEELFTFVEGYSRLFGKGRALRRILHARRDRTNAVGAVYVGDEVRDVEAARAARVSAVAVTWGFHAEPLLRQAGPDRILTEPGQLAELG